MLTRQTAIERLRQHGTLASFPRPETAITSEMAKDPLYRTISRIFDNDARSCGPRCLAPSSCHAVLP